MAPKNTMPAAAESEFDEKAPLRDTSSDDASSSSSSDESRWSFSGKLPKFGRSKGYAALEMPAEADEFAGLPADEAVVLREQIESKTASSNYFKLFRYATAFDRAVVLTGVLAALLEGLLKPIMALVFGSLTGTLSSYRPASELAHLYPANATFVDNGYYYECNATHADYAGSTYYDGSAGTYYCQYESMYVVTEDEFRRSVDRLSLYLMLIGLADVVLSTIKTFVFIDRGEVLSARIRENYLAAILRQNIGYFDKIGPGEITSRIASDTLTVQEAISEKLGFIIANSSTLVSAVVVAYTQSAVLASIMISLIIATILTSGISTIFMVRYQVRAQDGYSVGSTVAEEVIGSVRNVQAFGIQDRMTAIYDKFLVVTEKWSTYAGIAVGVMNGTMYLCSFSVDSLAYWQGTKLLIMGRLDVAKILTMIFAVFHGAYSFALISPYLNSLTSGIAAATKIFSTIDRPSPIDSSSTAGAKLATVAGCIELRDVKFIYPSRPNVTVMNNFSLTIPAGQTVALVGASGSGKSTIVGLIERFYNPIRGEVLLDGHNIADLNIRWLRQKIALVSQEPTLFACTIRENIEYGLVGTEYEHASAVEKQALVEEACKQANAFDFISALPEGLETNVGERGFLLSGGQKQRIAIARAIVGNPKILLLDEATSALDTKSEGVVQDALDRASKNRTTIVIAHRLSTIKDADMIVVMRRGEILETGTHDELLAKGGEYHGLVQAQQIEALKEKVAQPGGDAVEDALDEKAAIELDELDKRSTLGLSKTRTALAADVAVGDVESQGEARYSTLELVKLIFDLSYPERKYNYIGFVSCIVSGFAYPSLGLIYGRNVTAFRDETDYESLFRVISRMSGFLFLLASVLGLSQFTTASAFGYSSAKLVRRIRHRAFRQILRQDIAYFDRDDHTVGSLTNMLSRDAQAVEGLGGITLGKIIDSAVTVVSSAVLGIAIAPKFGIVVAGAIPILMTSGFYRFYLLAKFEENAKAENEQSASFACEATSAIRTVASLTREEAIWTIYHDNLQAQIRAARPASVKSAFFYGICQGMLYFIMSLGFWYGSRYLASGEYNVFQFYTVFVAIVLGAEGAGVVFSFAPDIGKALSATRNLKTLLDGVPEIDTWSAAGATPVDVEGNIEFRDVHFRYPTRPEVPILRGLDLTIKKGQYVALVGSSGCGKSTTISLIESYYRPLAGEVCLDGQNIAEFNINEYRKQIALVQQEPTLYAGSIRENIELGAVGPVTEAEIVAVCKQANIHDFVMSLPDGYDTLCGSKGTLLSGGQKQRIAIARALIRNPKILLLDEATSALDSESEKIVQAALDAAAKGRTTIAVAHRLSTIQNADVIYVFENGKVLEAGTHQELLANKSKYYELVQLQALERN
ncbi:P-loop containing nucleoside triphosphate hydrolase protein [Dipodascopsis tothii]|uniref:P-loop containing nucleoside triphosphate hydrolase protein n=1 Tax=Dipodascopsis tothii TaxID=44089 RepID=UPI0034CE3D0F